jgi:hypothetical protein
MAIHGVAAQIGISYGTCQMTLTQGVRSLKTINTTGHNNSLSHTLHRISLHPTQHSICLVLSHLTVSELRPPTGLLFIPRVICEHGELWWMMSTGENSRFIHQSAIWQVYL